MNFVEKIAITQKAGASVALRRSKRNRMLVKKRITTLITGK